ncbi:MAG: hypothetical protein ACPG5P_08000, partial [Saprospiraceae bacterium]
MSEVVIIYGGQEKDAPVVKALYREGVLFSLAGICYLKQVFGEGSDVGPIPIQLSDVHETVGGVVTKRMKITALSRKIAMFAAEYKKRLGVNYVVAYREKLTLKHLNVNKEILEAYFTNTEWWGKQPKSIFNFGKNYNAVRVLISYKNVKSKNPHGFKLPWTKKYEDSLPTPHL